MPARQEPAERSLLGGLDLPAQCGERGAAQPPQDLRVAPFPLGAAGAQLAADEVVTPLELAQRRLDVAAEALVRLRGRERTARAREPPNQRLERLFVGFEEDLRQPARRHRADSVAVAPGVLGGDQTVLPRHPDAHRPPLLQQRLREILGVLACAEIAAPAQEIVQLIGGASFAAELLLHLRERAGVDQVAQLLLAEQLLQQVAVERQRLRPPLRGRRVVLVHVVRDVVEEQ